MRTIAIMGIFLMAISAAFGAVRADSARVTITYLAGDAVYISVGRNAGVADSSFCFVLERRDTIAVLKVVAMSSKSSVCRIITTRRPLRVGEAVSVPFVETEAPVAQAATPARDSTLRTSDTLRIRKVSPAQPPALALHGRVNAQYSSVTQSTGGPTLKRPGIVLNLRGALRDIPVKFELYGNFRSLSYGGPLFGGTSVNQNRIYTLSLQYDDGLNHVAAGRVAQAMIGSAGSIDGVILSRRIDNLTVGVSGGYEPLFTQRSFGSDYRKFSLFSNYTVEGDLPASATVAYTRSFYHSALERDVASAAATITPSGDWFFMAQGDVDLHAKRGDALIAHPSLSNLYSSVRYRISQSVSAGVGVSAWRPTYAFSTVASIPDSQLDHTLRTSPSANVSVLFPSGISVYDTYSTRSSDGGFGKEYSNYSSLNVANLWGQGLSARGSLSFNTTAFARMRGLGGALQRSFLGFADATVRYQWYRYEYTSFTGVTTSKTAGFDLMISAFPALTFWGSLERMMSKDANTTSVFLDIGWRF